MIEIRRHYRSHCRQRMEDCCKSCMKQKARWQCSLIQFQLLTTKASLVHVAVAEKEAVIVPASMMGYPMVMANRLRRRSLA